MNRELKILLVIAGVLAVAYLINSYSSENYAETKDNSASGAMNEVSEDSVSQDSVEGFADLHNIPQDDSNDSYTSDSSLPSVEFGEGEKAKLKSKHRSKNSARAGKYKRMNYKDGKRGQSHSDASKYFEDHNSLVKDGHLANDEYAGRDETNDKFASYRTGPKKSLTDEDIFKSENYLPKEANKDWFEVMPEPISIKNRHLINVSRPVGVNTIGSSLRNPSYDLRGSPPNPKFVVSPWMQSTMEPDLNIKGLC
jgi:hypothetical protein